MLKQGREIIAIFQRPAPFGAWGRIAFDGEIPTLPPSPRTPPAEENDDTCDPSPDFYPDEDWPD